MPLRRVTPAGDSVEIAGRKLGGFGRVAALNTQGPYYAGLIAEIPLGAPPASDLNGNGTVGDTAHRGGYPGQLTDGCSLPIPTGDGSLAGRTAGARLSPGPREFGWAARGRQAHHHHGRQFSAKPESRSSIWCSTRFGHGSHVAGIAAGNDLYGVAGFDGVAPGAQLLGLKIANSAQGSITTTGSMIRAVDYAIRFAEARRLPLVLNLSFGVGNEIEGQARIDALIDSVLEAHPEPGVHHRRRQRWAGALHRRFPRLG